jgi:hypothetical protein
MVVCCVVITDNSCRVQCRSGAGWLCRVLFLFLVLFLVCAGVLVLVLVLVRVCESVDK